MADSKITGLTSFDSSNTPYWPPAPASDVIPIVDISDNTMAASGTTKKISINNLLSSSPTAGGNFTITGDLTVRTNKLKVDATGVAIGATSAAYLLDVRGTDTTNALIAGTTKGIRFVASASTSAIVGVDNTGAASYQPLSIGGSALDFSLSGSTAMTLNSTGLLIGTANNFASSRLCVQGTAGTSTPDVTIGIPVNSSGNTNLAIGRSASTNGYIFLDAYKAGVGGTELVLNSVNGGSVLIGLSTVVAAGGCLQLKSGITFPATQVASSNANTLDDYVEGTWTPTLNSGTFSSASCRYTKIGNMVTVFFDLTVGTGGGSQITNLPFTAAATSTVSSGIYTNNQTYAAGTTSPVAVIGGSSTTLFFRTVGSGVAFSAMSLTAGANLTGSISYFV